MRNGLRVENAEDLNIELNRLINEEPLPENSYYQFSLFANEEGKFHYTFFSHWAGFADNTLKHEIREPSLIKAETAIKHFKLIKQPLLVISSIRDLVIYLYFLGGHALIEKSLGDEFLGHILKPSNSVYTYDKGFIDVDSLPEAMFNRAADPKLRMRLFKRDKMRCKICGASPKNNEHVELHLHHILPFGKGGLTNESNLITLCHTCHKGLEPHLDYSLYSLIDVRKVSNKSAEEKYIDRIRRNVETSIRRLTLKDIKQYPSANDL